MTVWLLIKVGGSNYRVFQNKPCVEQIVHHFYYGTKDAETLASEVINGGYECGWYLTEQDVE